MRGKEAVLIRSLRQRDDPRTDEHLHSLSLERSRKEITRATLEDRVFHHRRGIVDPALQQPQQHSLAERKRSVGNQSPLNRDAPHIAFCDIPSIGRKEQACLSAGDLHAAERGKGGGVSRYYGNMKVYPAVENATRIPARLLAAEKIALVRGRGSAMHVPCNKFPLPAIMAAKPDTF